MGPAPAAGGLAAGGGHPDRPAGQPGARRRASRPPWCWRGARSGRCRPSCPATCPRAGTGSRAGPAPPPWWSRPGAATCRRSWTAGGAPGAGRPSCTRSARGPAGASATSATWPGCWRPRRPWAPGSPCSTRCTPPCRPSRAPTTPPAGCSATRSTSGSRTCPSWPPSTRRSGPGSRRLAAAGRGLLDQDRIDRPAVYRLKDEALRLAHGGSTGSPGRRDGLAAYRAATPNLERFATFCALQHVHGNDWRAWPAGYRHPGRPEVAGVRRPAPRGGRLPRLAPVAARRAAGGRPAAAAGQLGVVNDLAIGFAPDGFDAWSFQDELAAGMSVGAPPDPLGPHGQDWGLPAFVPDRLAAGGYGPFAQTIRAGMAHAAGLRIDHVMGLFRLFWIPEGAEPAQGTYVRYPADDLLGILALESAAAQALVVGEDLGTVEPGVRERLAAEGVLSYRLAWFEHDPGGGPPPGRRLPPAGPGRHHHPRPAHRGRVLHRQRPGPPLRHRGGHPGRDRAGRPGGAAGQPLPAAGGRGPARAGRAVGRGDRGRPLRLPHPDPVHAGRGHPRGRRRGPRPAQRPRHHRPAPELVAAPARPARRPGRRPPGPAARRDPLGGDRPKQRPEAERKS